MNAIGNTTKSAGKTGAKTAKKRTAKATKGAAPVPPDIAAKFERKLVQLRETGIPRIGPAGPIRNLPDGGWQMDCGNAITIAMAPGTSAPFAVTGPIRDKWMEEGGAFDADGNPGKLGYPVSDTIPYTSMGRAADRISRFQEGDITWNSAKEVCYVSLNKPQFENAEETLPEGLYPKGCSPAGDGFPVWPAPQPNGQPSSIKVFIDNLSLEEKFEALERLIAAIKEETEDLQARCDEAEEALDEAESSRDEDEDE